jgi:hypothetical protein
LTAPFASRPNQHNPIDARDSEPFDSYREAISVFRLRAGRIPLGEGSTIIGGHDETPSCANVALLWSFFGRIDIVAVAQGKISKRMIKKQQMRWIRWIVQPFLDVRVAVLNKTLAGSFKRLYPDFRPNNEIHAARMSA